MASASGRITTHNLGYPRIGAQRELKFALESFWRGDSDAETLLASAAQLRRVHWQDQAGLDLLPVGDFSLYDQVLDMSLLLGNIPARARQAESGLDTLFQLARGRSGASCAGIHAGEMTKWFDTNYHYIVPELNAGTTFSLNPQALLDQVREALALGIQVKPVIIGPVTYLWLGKVQDASDRLALLPPLLKEYGVLLEQLGQLGVEWVQIDEPVLVTDLSPDWQQALELAYHTLKATQPKILLATYFGALQDNLQLACRLPVQGLHADAVAGIEDVPRLVDWLPSSKILSLGVIDGRNVWKADLAGLLDWLEPIHQRLGARLWLAPSCSLLHVPVDLRSETELPDEVQGWLAFARQKLKELQWLARGLTEGRAAIAGELADNAAALRSRQASTRVRNPAVRQAVSALNPQAGERHSTYSVRVQLQQEQLKLPVFPTTTIGSFPQTTTIRQQRSRWRRGEINDAQYRQFLRQEIAHCIQVQENLGLDVLVHGEAERGDMVEHFGEQLQGFAFTKHGWVQSYGSRCVKPPILYGDIARAAPMTVDWINYAQTLTDRPVKGMLTGPVTLLNWSFVRNDQPRSETCRQLALAVRDEVLDLEASGVQIIQIDEAALREGLPLRRSQWQEYLDWAIGAFRIAANGVQDTTQIHTHMCYSEFNDIMEAIIAMDTDVITIEAARSNLDLLDALASYRFPSSIGPGVYDIHSPNIPAAASMTKTVRAALEYLPAGRLWINPDCGLKTRQWDEVIPALTAMVAAARALRASANS